MQIKGIAGLMDVFGGSRQTWRQRIDGGMPVEIRQPDHSGRPHQFDSQAVLEWLLTQASGFENGDLDPAQERARLDQARRKLCELQVAERERELIPADVVQRVWSRVTSDARQRFLAMPATLIPDLLEANGDADALMEAVTRRIYEALTDVSEIDIEKYV